MLLSAQIIPPFQLCMQAFSHIRRNARPPPGKAVSPADLCLYEKKSAQDGPVCALYKTAVWG